MEPSTIRLIQATARSARLAGAGAECMPVTRRKRDPDRKQRPLEGGLCGALIGGCGIRPRETLEVCCVSGTYNEHLDHDGAAVFEHAPVLANLFN
jgi:hypothetical protein